MDSAPGSRKVFAPFAGEPAISASIDRRSLLLASAGLAAGCATPPWTPPAPHTFRVIEHTPIPMRDGVKLSARLWLPDGVTAPAVLECIPYRKHDLYRPYDDMWGETLAKSGIAFIRLDVRGSGDSEGVITDEYSEAELADCVEAIAWIASQGWCNGAVGMRGISWGGINTLQVAARRPPALKAIMPMCACDRRYTDDAHYVGGGLGRTNFQWGVLFKKVMAGPPDPSVAGENWRDLWRQRLEATPPILATWLQHQREDDYWKRGSVFEKPSDIDIPAYLVSGWSDTYAVSMLRLSDKLPAPTKVLIGPWGHTYPYTAPQGLDWAHEEIRWWRHWLMGEATGIMDEPRVRLFMPNATASESGPIPGRWISNAHWPLQTAQQRWFLNSAILAQQPATAADIIHRDRGLVGMSKPEWLDRLPVEQSSDDKLSAVFDTLPLDEPVEIAGTPRLTLHVASDQPIANVFVRLSEVRPDGASWLVTWAALNLTRRNAMCNPSPLEPGRTYTVPLDLRAIAHRFRAGSRVRLAISESFWPMLWPSPVKPTLTLPTGVSTLTLPVRTPEAAPASFPIDQGANASPPASNGFDVIRTDGRIILSATTRPAPYPVPGAGTELSSGGEESCEISPDYPLSCRWRQTTRSTWRRGDWDCAVEASYDLTADASLFHLIETLRATSNGEEIFTRTHTTHVPRDLL